MGQIKMIKRIAIAVFKLSLSYCGQTFPYQPPWEQTKMTVVEKLAVMGGRGVIQQLFLGSTTCFFCCVHVYSFP